MSFGRFLESRLIANFNRNAPKPAPRPTRPGKVPEKQPPPGFLVGMEQPFARWQRGDAYVTIDPADLGKPQYIIARSGWGKTIYLRMLIRHFIQAGLTVVFIDLRGDAVQVLLGDLVNMGVDPDRVIVIDAGEEDWVTPWNFLGAGSGDPYRRVMPLLEFLDSHAGGIGPQTLHAMRAAFVGLAETGGSLAEVEPLLRNPGYLASVVERMEDPHAKDVLSQFAALKPERQLSWSLPISNKLSPLLAPPMSRRMISCSGVINLGEILNTPGNVLLVSLGVDKNHEAAHLLGKQLVGAIESLILSRGDVPEKARTPVRIVIDEFENFTGASFSSLICEGRRFGCALTVAHQTTSQLNTETRDLIRGNATVRLIGGLAAADASDLASEIVDLEREDARKALMSLKTGEAVLVRTGQRAVKVAITPPTTQTVPAEYVAALRLKALGRYGRTRDEVDLELTARREAIERMQPRNLEGGVRSARLPQLEDES